MSGIWLRCDDPEVNKQHHAKVYGKARLQKKFNERLEELGYDPDVVMKIAEFILLRNP